MNQSFSCTVTRTYVPYWISSGERRTFHFKKRTFDLMLWKLTSAQLKDICVMDLTLKLNYMYWYTFTNLQLYSNQFFEARPNSAHKRGLWMRYVPAEDQNGTAHVSPDEDQCIQFRMQLQIEFNLDSPYTWYILHGVPERTEGVRSRVAYCHIAPSILTAIGCT